jgi:hypothetical protein
MYSTVCPQTWAVLEPSINECPKQSGREHCIPVDRLLRDLVTNNATDDSTTHGSSGTAAGQHGTTHGADSGADRGALSLRRHTRTGAKTKQGGNSEYLERDFPNVFHGTNSF